MAFFPIYGPYSTMTTNWTSYWNVPNVGYAVRAATPASVLRGIKLARFHLAHLAAAALDALPLACPPGREASVRMTVVRGREHRLRPGSRRLARVTLA